MARTWHRWSLLVVAFGGGLLMGRQIFRAPSLDEGLETYAAKETRAFLVPRPGTVNARPWMHDFGSRRTPLLDRHCGTSGRVDLVCHSQRRVISRLIKVPKRMRPGHRSVRERPYAPHAAIAPVGTWQGDAESVIAEVEHTVEPGRRIELRLLINAVSGEPRARLDIVGGVETGAESVADEFVPTGDLKTLLSRAPAGGGGGGGFVGDPGSASYFGMPERSEIFVLARHWHRASGATLHWRWVVTIEDPVDPEVATQRSTGAMR